MEHVLPLLLFMRNPRLTFTISKKVDLEVGLAFRAMKSGGVDFKEWGILVPHPELRDRRLTTTAIIAYTERFYREHEKELEKARLKFVRSWQDSSKTFFNLTKTLFGPNFPTPNTYTCYPSMWNCNPRDIPHRTFQIFYRHPNPVELMAHEMLHFAFYQYVYERYPRRKRARDSQKLWELSEAFNTIVLNSPEWREKLRLRRQPPYPMLRNLVKTMRRRWAQNTTLNAMIDGFLK